MQKRVARGCKKATTPEERAWLALHERKGKVAATLHVGPTPTQILHSTKRTDSYEVLTPRGYVRGGRGKIGLYLGSLMP